MLSRAYFVRNTRKYLSSNFNSNGRSTNLNIHSPTISSNISRRSLSYYKLTNRHSNDWNTNNMKNLYKICSFMVVGGYTTAYYNYEVNTIDCEKSQQEPKVVDTQVENESDEVVESINVTEVKESKETYQNEESQEIDTKSNSKNNNEGDEIELDNKTEIDEDPYENLSEEDEPTSCVICLINRQGPCRSVWRKFERCMKDNPSSDDDDDDDDNDNNDDENNNNSKSTMAEKCDKYMFPWITCVQSYRNTYTLISNAFFQKELIDEIEKTVNENQKVILKDIDVSSIIQISHEWWDGFDNSSDSDAQDTNISTANHEKVVDATLVEGLARINLYDGDKPIEVAYVKDQDGNLLGYDQFTDFKKSLISKEESGSDSDSNPTQKVAQCNFHVNPDTTKGIQIFALYKMLEDDEEAVVKEDTNIMSQTNSNETDSDFEKDKQKQTLYVSSLVLLNDLPNPSDVDKSNEKESVEKSD